MCAAENLLCKKRYETLEDRTSAFAAGFRLSNAEHLTNPETKLSPIAIDILGLLYVSKKAHDYFVGGDALKLVEEIPNHRTLLKIFFEQDLDTLDDDLFSRTIKNVESMQNNKNFVDYCISALEILSEGKQIPNDNFALMNSYLSEFSRRALSLLSAGNYF